jgi:dTDP-4-dehydrorhamnose reductase
LVAISTDYVFDGEKEGFYTQRDQPGPESIYGLSKLEGERRAELANARTILVRTGFIFGPGGSNFSKRPHHSGANGLHFRPGRLQFSEYVRRACQAGRET